MTILIITLHYITLINIKRVIHHHSASTYVKGHTALCCASHVNCNRESKRSTYFESPTPLCLFSVQLLWGCNND